MCICLFLYFVHLKGKYVINNIYLCIAAPPQYSPYISYIHPLCFYIRYIIYFFFYDKATCVCVCAIVVVVVIVAFYIYFFMFFGFLYINPTLTSPQLLLSQNSILFRSRPGDLRFSSGYDYEYDYSYSYSSWPI